MHVRDYQPEDEATVAALWREVFGYTETRNEPAGVLGTKAAWDSRILVALAGDRVLGSLLIGYDGHRGWFYRLAVAADCRRQGIGHALVREGERRLAALGCKKVNLQLHTHNEAGALFWEALGYGREARISMGKELNSASAPHTVNP
jgi:ribosomal protein S18 acetylase RimI-like enzyme